ncbi:hypothetical protein Dimus_022632 [Dionaea muscipula]
MKMAREPCDLPKPSELIGTSRKYGSLADCDLDPSRLLEASRKYGYVSVAIREPSELLGTDLEYLKLLVVGVPRAMGKVIRGGMGQSLHGDGNEWKVTGVGSRLMTTGVGNRGEPRVS